MMAAFSMLSTASHISRVMRSSSLYARMTTLLLTTSEMRLLTSERAVVMQYRSGTVVFQYLTQKV